MDGYESSRGHGKDDHVEAEGDSADAADDEIMTKLPRSRPQRKAPAAAPRRPARSRAASPPRAASAPDPAVFGPREPAPGLPRLALHGAIEAAKLPAKVGANVTIRALDAVIKGLRRQ